MRMKNLSKWKNSFFSLLLLFAVWHYSISAICNCQDFIRNKTTLTKFSVNNFFCWVHWYSFPKLLLKFFIFSFFLDTSICNSKELAHTLLLLLPWFLNYLMDIFSFFSDGAGVMWSGFYLPILRNFINYFRFLSWLFRCQF